MSKKIIYLLSLLMALSLVFASCKKNGITDALGGLKPPADTSQGEDVAGEDGLFTEYGDIPNGEIANIGVFVTTDGNYYRNPVIVARDNGEVFVFAEKRWKSRGTGNDVGIDGDAVTDIVYKVSDNSGYKFGTQEYTVGKAASASNPKGTSHGAPVVFVQGNNIVVVATSGSGIGRSSKTISVKGNSKIDYIKGTFQNDGTITWSNDWTEIKLSESSIQALTVATKAGGSGNKNFDQYGTQPSRGFVANNGTMYLDVVLAQQNTLSDPYELMGRMTISASISNPATWTKVEDPVAYTAESVKLGPWKETKLISDGTGTGYKHLVVPSPWTTATKPNVLAIPQGQSTKPSDSRTSIKASEGSPGFFITADKWFGSTQYKIKTTGGEGTLKVTGIEPDGDNGNGTKMVVLVHVQQTASQLYLYCVNDQLVMQGSKGWKLDNVGKSSSVDMMLDGTVVVAAEKGGEEQNYFIRFLRYSQKYITTQTGGK